MTKDHIRRWTWTLALFCSAIGLIWMLAINQGTLATALGGGLVCGLIPLLIGAWLLFAPSESSRSALSYMGRKPPSIADFDNPVKGHVKRKPKVRMRQ
jgi:hypothetical protein